jgi:c-di-GMP-binding flagellar brake protein YcgR
MTEFNLPMGTELFINHSEDDEENYSCATLIGFLYAQSLIVTLPKRKDHLVQVEKGDELIIRFSKGDTIYAFSSKVMEINQSPYPHIHLTYPENIQAKLLRRGNRIEVSKNALQLKIKNNDFDGAVIITNISEFGAKLTSSSKLGELDEKLTIELDLPQYPEVVELNCKICHTDNCVDQDSNKETYEHGIEFFEINTMARSFINSFIHEHIEREKSSYLKSVPN